MSSLRTDGKAVEVTLTETTAKDTLVYLEGFFGITLAAGSSGDTVAIEIAQRVHELTVGAGITADKGDILYISDDGDITNTDTDTPFGKVVLAKDSNNVVWVLLLPQKSE